MQFQFTPLREGRHSSSPPLLHGFHFNSRPSARGDYSTLPFISPLLISIHAPPRGATGNAEKGDQQEYFNSRPSARGDHGRNPRRCSRLISIHAPPRGATRLLLAVHQQNARFQFTPLREGRPWLVCLGLLALLISIHAPPRGATARSLRESNFALFQFTPLREGRPPKMKHMLLDLNFNSRPSARGD